MAYPPRPPIHLRVRQYAASPSSTCLPRKFPSGATTPVIGLVRKPFITKVGRRKLEESTAGGLNCCSCCFFCGDPAARHGAWDRHALAASILWDMKVCWMFLLPVCMAVKLAGGHHHRGSVICRAVGREGAVCGRLTNAGAFVVVNAGSFSAQQYALH